MTDPFSVAGTAVGITSLGIQVCQSLVRYYSQYRSFHDDIDTVLQRVEGLQSILKTIASVKNRVESSDEPSAELQAALKACQSAVDSLKKMAEKCNETKTPGSTQDVACLVKKRLLWPFRKETLVDTQKALDGLQANLLVALQAIGIDVENRHFEVIKTGHEHIEGHLDKQSVTLQKIDEDIQTISSVQLSHTSNVTSHMTDISNQYSQLSLQMSTMEQTLSLLVSSDGRPHDPSKLPLGLLTDGIESTQDLVPSFRRNLRRYKKSAVRLGETNPFNIDICNCQYRRRRQKRSYWGLFEVSEEYDHLPSCSLFPHTNYSRTIEARYNRFARMLGVCVTVGLTYGRMTGSMTFSPSLRLRRVVSEDSPAFRILRNAHKSAWEIFHRGYLLDRKEIERLCSGIICELRECFQKGIASPYDELYYGKGLLVESCGFVENLLRKNMIDPKTITQFLDSILGLGISDMGTNYHLGPLDELRYSCDEISSISSLLDIFRHLVKHLSSWSISSVRSKKQSLLVAEVLKIEEANNLLQEESPLLLAVLQRSEIELTKCLSITILETKENRQIQRAVHLSTFWPTGLEILLHWVAQYWGYNILHDLNMEPNIFDSCLGSMNEQIIRNFLDTNPPVNMRTWRTACINMMSAPEVLQLEVFEYIATRLKKDSPVNSLPPLDPGHESPWKVKDYYHVVLPLIAANCLWSAGFQEVNQPTWDSIGSGTVLWYYSCLDIYQLLSEELFSMLKWLVAHGCQLDWMHPEFGTTPAHVIAGRMLPFFDLAIISNPGSTDIVFMSDILRMDHCDHCYCLCSKRGCQVIGCTSQARSRWKRSLDILTGGNVFYEYLREVVVELIDSEDKVDRPWMGTAVLRVFTFEELGMTHTCCYKIIDEVRRWRGYSRPMNDEICDIRYAESKQGEILESLMFEFESGWMEYEGGFEEFLLEIWRPRMEEICGELSDVDEEEVERIRELGVVLDEDGGESDPIVKSL